MPIFTNLLHIVPMSFGIIGIQEEKRVFAQWSLSPLHQLAVQLRSCLAHHCPSSRTCSVHIVPMSFGIIGIQEEKRVFAQWSLSPLHQLDCPA
jgi:hypothetical protein